MRLKEFAITRYGPVSEKGPFHLSNFNLFFGRNEEGKTLMLDSIVRFLFKKTSKIFNRIDRVDENPEGFLIIEMGKGEEIKFPEKEELTRFTGLSAREYRDIFIIRSSDLSIDEEDGFYRNVQNRLTGLRTDEIDSINKQLLEIGRLTPGGDFRKIKGEQLKTRLLDAQKLIKEIEILKGKIDKEGLEGLEEVLFKNRKSIETLEEKLNDYEKARKRERYEQGIASLNSLNDAIDILKGLEIYAEEDEELWRDSERDIRKYGERKTKLDRELDEKEREFKERRKEFGKKEQDFRVYKNRKKSLDDEIMPEIKNYEKQRQDFAKGKSTIKIITISEFIFGLLCGISILGYIIRHFPFLKFSSIVFGVLTILLFFGNIWFLRKKWGLLGLSERIKIMTEKFGLSAKEIEDIMRNIHRFLEEYGTMDEELNSIKNVLTIIENETKRLKQEIPDLDEKVRKSEKIIEKIKRKSGIETREAYNKKLNEKSKYEKIWAQESGILKSNFGVSGKSEEERIQYWKSKIDEYEAYKNEAKDISYDEKTVSRLKSKRDALIEANKGIRKRMSGFTDELKGIERTVNSAILKTTDEDYLHCITIVDINGVKESLKSFIEQNEQMRETVLGVKEIFVEIEREEEEKVASLFGKESPVSSYFSMITDGMYQNVVYDTEEGSINVLSKDGELLSAEKLSSGAYDQLYLSIRLALGEKILKGEKGFFIMDDPFVKADLERLRRQLNILKELSLSGWQIIYFTAKNEIRDCLKDEIKYKQISYFEI